MSPYPYKLDHLNELSVKYTGRGITDSTGTYWCALSGSGFECHFKGNYLSLTLCGGNASKTPDNDGNWARYAVYVNGMRTAEGLLDSFNSYKTVDIISCGSIEGIEADIKFIKLSECAMSTLGIVSVEHDGEITATADKPLKLEVIGDSITCGYGVDEYDPEKPFKTATEDFTKGYAYKTAKLLDADVRAFSVSGWGIISGYVGSPDEAPHKDQLIPPYYTKLGFSYDKFGGDNDPAPQDIDHDFSCYVPDIIVVNLGTNDNSWCTGHEDRYSEYVKEYAKFLETVHNCNPSSKLLCVMGIMLDEIAPYMEKAVEIFRERSGFEKIYTMRFTPQDGKLGYGADWHPSPATHDRAAAVLADKIRGIIKL